MNKIDEYSNYIVQEDISDIIKYPLNWLLLKNKTILITGATGMIAKYVIYTLLILNKTKNLGINIIALARNENKLKQTYASNENNLNFTYLVQDVCDEINYNGKIDYIFHFASNSNVTNILTNPVEIIKSNTIGTINILELARKTNNPMVVFASTREIYGEVREDISEIDETTLGYIDPLDERSCYPESKKMAENLCKSYSFQYGIRYKILRIAHIYGPGMNIINDGRIMSDLIYSAVHNTIITLKGNGQSERAFCYISDAVLGIFAILLNGKQNEAYNLANELEPCKIIDLANLLIELFPNKLSKVEINTDPNATLKGYYKYKRKKLSTKKLESIGWFPTINLKNGLLRTVNSFDNK
jgi:nucleoside-diphosphate-sugar epimerase